MSAHYSVARLRQGVVHFLVGKVGSALLTFSGFLLMARLLSPADYGRYVALIALVELGLNLAGLGLDWVSTRYVPEYRVKAPGRELAGFVMQLVALQALALIGVAALLAAMAPWVVALLGIGEATQALRLYALYLVVEGLSRVLRDQMLGQLLLQGRAQLALLLRQLAWVGLAGLLWSTQGHAPLQTVAIVELAAASLGLLAAAAGLGHALWRARGEMVGVPHVWQPPPLAEMQRLAANSYLGLLLNIPARPQVITLLVTRLAGVEAAALYGFARSLADQVLRFLPAELLLGFVRPAMVARYVQSRRFADLNGQTNTLLMVSLLVLAPLLALVIARGELLVQVLGAGRFGGSGVLLALMLMAAALFSHRRMLEFVANTVDRPQIIGQASVLLLAVPLAVFVALAWGWPVWAVPLSALLFEALFGVLAIWLLRRAGVAYRAPLGPIVRMGVLVAVVAGGLATLPLSLPPVWSMTAYGGLALVSTVLVATWIRPLGDEAQVQLKSWFNKRGSKS